VREAAHDYIAQLVGAKRVGKVVRLQRTNPAVSGSMSLRRLSGFAASGQIVAHRIDTIERAAVDVAPISAGASDFAATAPARWACAG
jgi:hypothetical protein